MLDLSVARGYRAPRIYLIEAGLLHRTGPATIADLGGYVIAAAAAYLVLRFIPVMWRIK
jgi:hypothetical protein